MIDVTFWGVRGSIASPGDSTAKVGGNTSCVEVRCGDKRIILDAGTGLRALGQELCASADVSDVLILLSHYHWDHIQGLPFFVPIYMPQAAIEIVGGTLGEGNVRDALQSQMRSPSFPVDLRELPSTLRTREMRSGERMLRGDIQIRAQKLNHPGGVFGYRIEFDGTSVVYATDTEHYACVDPAMIALAEGADLLIYDAQYTPAEYAGEHGPSKVGWGHSTYVAGCEIARRAGVKQLALFHHDPMRSDDAIVALEREAQKQFAPTFAAREGASVKLEQVTHKAA
jgi:phosphoribosyl 1,2-cyclic phosphodiesterase